MTQFDTDNLNAPHTLRELGVDAAPVIDTSRDAVERLLEGVTPGPWVHTLEKRDEFWFGNGHWAVGQFVASDNYGADARFIAAARDLVPALLARAEAAEAEVARLRRSDSVHRGMINKLLSEGAKQMGRAEAAEAEVARLREALAGWEGTTRYTFTGTGMRPDEAGDWVSIGEMQCKIAMRKGGAA